MPPNLRNAEEVRRLASLLTDPSAPLPASTEWETLVASAIQERVAPLLLHRFEVDRREAAMPQAVQTKLQRELYHSGARNLVHDLELKRLIATGPTRFLVLKGGALAHWLYENPALRPMSDLDILVPAESVREWTEHVHSLGYQDSSPEMAPGLARRCHYQWAFTGGPTGNVIIELHWSLVGGELDWRAPTMSWFWQQAEPWAADGSAAKASKLSDTASLLYACAHLELQHGGSRAPLIWLIDIHRLSERGRVGWPELVEQAGRFGWTDAVRSALERARQLFHTNVETAVLERLETSSSPRSARLVHDKADPAATRAETVWQELVCLDWLARIQLAGAILLPQVEYMRWRYPTWGRLWPAAYFYRWLLVVSEGLTGLARRSLARPTKP